MVTLQRYMYYSVLILGIVTNKFVIKNVKCNVMYKCII